MVYSKDLDVVIATEAWLTPTVLDKYIHLAVMTYIVATGQEIEEEDRGGVLVAIKSDIQNKRQADLESQ